MIFAVKEAVVILKLGERNRCKMSFMQLTDQQVIPLPGEFKSPGNEVALQGTKLNVRLKIN